MPTVTLQQAFELALQHHQAGRLAEAEALYRQILGMQPAHDGALHHLGLVAHQTGRSALAIELIRQAITLNPSQFAAHSNLGAILAEQGQLDESIAACRRALQFKPDAPEALHNLGNALQKRGQFDEAVAAYQRALQFAPDCPEVYLNLGNALRRRNQLDQAESAYRRALQLRPDYPDAYINLGHTLGRQGKIDEAIAACRRALQLQPNDAAAHTNLGTALATQGKFDEAIQAHQRALQLEPTSAEASNNLGTALAGREDLDEAVAAFRHALELNPRYADAHANLGVVLTRQGLLDESIAAYRRALQFNPAAASTHSNLILSALCHPAFDQHRLNEEYARWEQQHARPLRGSIQPHANSPNPERRLKVGYVSRDFRDHVVGRNVLPLLENHDREHFEILCYSTTTQPDSITDRFRSAASERRDVKTLSDSQLAEVIRADGVDILVDLALHSAGNRLPMFAREPAPVQVSFAGYPASTGVETIHYRLSDRYLEPPDSDLPTPHSEQISLLDTFWCYDPCGLQVEINPLPAEQSGRVTFGSLNNFSKINPPVLQLWARILGQCPDSHLVLLTNPGSHRQRVQTFLQQQGIEPHRVEFVGRGSRREYLELYHRLDLALDSFPYNGHTTSLDALWMGVPVVTLTGKTSVARAGFSQLSNLGLPELVASSEEEYARIATELAHDLPRLALLRRTLRPRMGASLLMDAPLFTRRIEVVFRSFWRHWCASR